MKFFQAFILRGLRYVSANYFDMIPGEYDREPECRTDQDH